MKKILLTALISLFVIQNNYGQPKLASKVTTTMAKKICYYCQYNNRALSLFANANSNIVQNRTDLTCRLLDKLEKHLDCAENFIIMLYSNYGSEMSYFALKDAGFTVHEIDIAELIWNKEKKKEESLNKKRRKEEEKNILRRIENNEIFSENFLSIKPKIEIDISDATRFSVYNNNDEYLNYTYSCIINKEGKLSLVNMSDTIGYSPIQKILYQYISQEEMGRDAFSPGYITINEKDIPVNSYFEIEFKEHRHQHRGYLDIVIKKNQKTEQWEFVDNIKLKLQQWTCDEPDVLLMDLQNALYQSTTLTEMTGKVQLKIYVYKRVLSSNISGETNLSHSFKMSYRKGNFGGFEEYTPLDYKITF